MAWIETIAEEDATGRLKEIYDQSQSQMGFVGNIVKAHSLKPDFIDAWAPFMRAVAFGGTSLGRRREEMLAVLISAHLKCRYCTTSHAAMLCSFPGDQAMDKSEVLAVKNDFRTAGLSRQDEAMLDYGEKITLAPHTVTKADIDNLRSVGFSDTEILEIATLAAYRNYIARVASALGVAVDDAHFADDPEMKEAIGAGTV